MAKAKGAAKKKSAAKKAGSAVRAAIGTVKKTRAKTAAKPAGRTAKAAKPAKPAKPAKKDGKRQARDAAKAAKKAAKKIARRVKAIPRRFVKGDAELWTDLTEGERADALRILIEDRRLANMAKVGRYRVIAAEPLVTKPPHPLSGHRLARIVAYDYASDRCVEASVDLDTSELSHLQITRSQPMLAREEEAAAVAIALADDRVKSELGLGDEPQVAMHYWSRRDADLAYSRRSAAVIFGQAGRRPSLIVVVDLLDNQVAELVPADQW